MLKLSTRRLIAARKKPYSGGAMYHDIKKFPIVAGARKSAANALKRLRTKHGSKKLRQRLIRQGSQQKVGPAISSRRFGTGYKHEA